VGRRLPPVAFVAVTQCAAGRDVESKHLHLPQMGYKDHLQEGENAREFFV